MSYEPYFKRGKQGGYAIQTPGPEILVEKQISNFTIEECYLIRDRFGDMVRLVRFSGRHTFHRLPADTLASSHRFQHWCHSVDHFYLWVGSDTHLQRLAIDLSHLAPTTADARAGIPQYRRWYRVTASGLPGEPNAATIASDIAKHWDKGGYSGPIPIEDNHSGKTVAAMKPFGHTFILGHVADRNSYVEAVRNIHPQRGFRFLMPKD